MTRRAVLRPIVTGLAAAAMLTLGAAGPAAAAPKERKVSVALASTHPSNQPQLGGLALSLTKKIARASGGTLDFRFHEPNALAPNAELFDAVASGGIEAVWSSPGYWAGRESALSLFSAIPFGPGGVEYISWLYYGGGRELWNEAHARQNVIAIPCGLTEPEAAGWFRREIKSTADLRGLRMRIAGLGGKVIAKLGVEPVQIAGGEILQALQLGSIDAAEFSMPAIDFSLGLHQAVRYYYFPGWHQPATLFSLMLSQTKWAEMSDSQRAIVEAACGDTIREGLAEGDAIQARALADLKAKGVQIRSLPPAVLTELEAAWKQVAAEESAANPSFKAVLASWQAFRETNRAWRELGVPR